MSNGTAIAHRPQARAYLAGTGASLALTAGAAAILLAVGAFVAFKGLPFGGHAAATPSVPLHARAAAAAAHTGAALAVAPRAVSAAPTGAARAAGGAAGSGSARGGGAGGRSAGVPSGAVGGGAVGSGGGAVTGTPTGTAPTTPTTLISMSLPFLCWSRGLPPVVNGAAAGF